MLVKTQNYLISVYRCNMLVKSQNYVISVLTHLCSLKRMASGRSHESRKKKKTVHILSQSKSQLKILEPKTTRLFNSAVCWAQALAVMLSLAASLPCCHWMLGPDERVRVAVCIVLYLYLLKVGKSTDTVYSKKKKKKIKKKNPARYVISIQISGERTAAAYVITVFTL